MNLQRQTYFSVSSVGVPIRNTADYSPFGVQLDGRTFQGDFYRRGFNGMEKDDEVKGGGNSYTTEFRQFDARLGRWLSLDPMMAKFPWQSPYVSFDNNPISLVDPLGSESCGPGVGDDPKKKGSKTSSKSGNSKSSGPIGDAIDKTIANVKSSIDAPKKAIPKASKPKTQSKQAKIDTKAGFELVTKMGSVSSGGIKIESSISTTIKESENGITNSIDDDFGGKSTTISTWTGTLTIDKESFTYGNSMVGLGFTKDEELKISISIPLVINNQSVNTDVYLDTKRWKKLGKSIMKSIEQANKSFYGPIGGFAPSIILNL